MKEFFGITEKTYKPEWADLSALLTILNVIFILLGYWWAPIIGIVNCVINIVLAVISRAHINIYALNLALVILNIYFLTL